MVERRALSAGLTDAEAIDPKLAEDFIYDKKPRLPAKNSPPEPATEKPAAPPPLPDAIVAAAQVPASSPLTGVGRVAVGARFRTELATALKRASLQRQLQGIHPFAVQEILEEAAELWLVKNGHPLK